MLSTKMGEIVSQLMTAAGLDLLDDTQQSSGASATKRRSLSILTPNAQYNMDDVNATAKKESSGLDGFVIDFCIYSSCTQF